MIVCAIKRKWLRRRVDIEIESQSPAEFDALTGEENTTCTPHHQKKIVANLKEDLGIRPLKNIEHRFYVQFPEVKDHGKHLSRVQEGVSILCEWPRKDLPISKGTGNILGHNIATLFSTHIKAKLKEIMELEEGDKRCYKPHWRHMRWIDRNDLTDHNIMNNSFKGMEERIKLLSKKKLVPLFLEDFALFKPKTVIGLLSPPGYYLSMKNCRNEKLMATLEDGAAQLLESQQKLGWEGGVCEEHLF
uniref:Uncharacterized protein n=1 Tax=Magallana gigas TaxID=29159 RepID=A0A8W8MG34_MAGGI